MNPEEQIQQGASEEPNAPQEVTQTEQTQTETTQAETAKPIQPESTIPTAPTETAQATPIAPVAPKEKKGKSWIIILIIFLALLLALFGAIWWTASKIEGAVDTFFYDVLGVTRLEDIKKKEETTKENSNKNEKSPVEGNPIIDADNKMRNELSSFDYTAKISSDAMGMSLNTEMNCTYDGKNKIEYCKTDLIMGLSQETYYDWGNGYEYTKTTSPYSQTYGAGEWVKTQIPSGANGAISVSDGKSFTNIQSETVDNGTKYTGEISGFTATGSEGSIANNAKMNFEIIVDNEGYIDSMTMRMDNSEDIKQYVDVEYSNFGTAQSLTIPAEALNAE